MQPERCHYQSVARVGAKASQESDCPEVKDFELLAVPNARSTYERCRVYSDALKTQVFPNRQRPACRWECRSLHCPSVVVSHNGLDKEYGTMDEQLRHCSPLLSPAGVSRKRAPANREA